MNLQNIKYIHEDSRVRVIAYLLSHNWQVLHVIAPTNLKRDPIFILGSTIYHTSMQDVSQAVGLANQEHSVKIRIHRLFYFLRSKVSNPAQGID